jgi:serine-type D-Ala-D-Ala carboxypeptidase/endopeptidase (penicillin-binding protein 4)
MKNYSAGFVVFFYMFFTFEIYAQVNKGEIQKNPVTSTVSPVAELRKDLDDIFNDPNFSNANWGVVIRSLETGEYLYRRNESKSFVPASNMKIFTTSNALMLLGPEYRYVTKLMTNGSITNNELNGDLIIKGSGDPTFPGTPKGTNILQLFISWADSLKSLGIKVVHGDIVGDDNCFDNQHMGAGWAWEDETFYWSAHISGLCFNDNCVDLTIAPGEYIGSNAKISVTPDTKYVTIKNEIRTITADSATEIDYYRKSGSNVVRAFGRYSIKSPQRIDQATVDNPTLYTATVFKEVLESRGIVIDGEPKDIDDANINRGTTTIFQTLNSTTSVPLSEIVRTINKKSQNLYAEQVFKTIGKEIGGNGSIQKATEIVKKNLSNIGIDPDKIMMYDGSGLSRMDLVMPEHIVTLLAYMYHHKYWKDFYNSLPIAGVDGGLAERMKGTRAANNVHAKTGFVNYVRALSGYLTTKDGEMLAFSMIVNHYTVPTSLANNIQDLVCIRLTNFSRKY